jgi:CBS domain-containing protein
MMATHRVHAILVVSHGEHGLAGGDRWGVISDAELVRVAQVGDLDEQAANSVAVTPVARVRPADDLGSATRIMAEEGLAHVIVVDPRSERPIGVLSRLDVVRALAGFPERHPLRS